MARLSTIIFFCAVSLLTLSGCMKYPGGAEFTGIEMGDETLSTIYFYRIDMMNSDTIHIEFNRKILSGLNAYGYIAHYVEPGTHRIWGKLFGIPNKAITLETEPGKVYFVKFELGYQFPWGKLYSKVVSEEEAVQDLKECSLQLAAPI